MNTLAIIGGGAAGLACAVEAARCANRRGVPLQVCVYEADEKVGRSILRSGNGRCNFSNARIRAWDSEQLAETYNNGAFVARVLQELERTAAEVAGAPALAGVVGSAAPAEATAPAAAPAALVAPAAAPDVTGDAGAADAAASAGVAGSAAPAASAEDPFGNVENQVLAFFRSLGLAWREEGEGRLYPYANKAQSLLDVLRGALAALGVQLRLEAPVAAVEPPRESGGAVTLRMADGSFQRAGQVVVAVGGTVAQGLLGAAAEFVPTRPVLGPLAALPAFEEHAQAGDAARAEQPAAKKRVKGKGKRKQADAAAQPASPVLNSLDNIRVRCRISLMRPDAEGRFVPVAEEQGEVLFRKYGLSGIAVFNLSRFARPGDRLLVDLAPGASVSQVADWVSGRWSGAQPDGVRLGAQAALQGFLLPNVARAVCKAAGVHPEAAAGPREAQQLAQAAKALAFCVQGIGDARQCQVRRGGVNVAQVSPRTLQLEGAPSIRVVGEALDVDASCGGYNLHWAWASGLLAARCAVAAL